MGRKHHRVKHRSKAIDEPGNHWHFGPQRELCPHYLFHRQRLNLGDVLGVQIQLGQQQPGDFGSALALHHLRTGSAFDHRPVEQAFGGRRSKQHGNLLAAARLAEDHDAVRIASKAFDVVPNPLERRNGIEHANVSGMGEMFTRQVAQVCEPERAQPVVNTDHDNVAAPGQIPTDEKSARIRPARKPAAVKPEHDWPFPVVVDARSPHVQEEAVFAFRRRRTVGTGYQSADLAASGRASFLSRIALGSAVPIRERILNPAPRLRLLGRHKPIAAGRGSSVPDAQEAVNPGGAAPAHLTIGRFNCRIDGGPNPGASGGASEPESARNLTGTNKQLATVHRHGDLLARIRCTSAADLRSPLLANQFDGEAVRDLGSGVRDRSGRRLFPPGASAASRPPTSCRSLLCGSRAVRLRAWRRREPVPTPGAYSQPGTRLGRIC